MTLPWLPIINQKNVVLPALPYVDYCFLSEFELERTTGLVVREQNGVNFAALQNAARQLIHAGVREKVVVHFPEGACAVGREGQIRHQGGLMIPQARIIGTVGAGDAFAAGVLYGLHEGHAIESALHCGVCVATSCLCGAGASDSIRRLDDCLKLEKEFGVTV